MKMSEFWDRDYQKANTLVAQISESIQKRLIGGNAKNKNADKIISGGGGKEAAILRGQLAQLSQEITQLSQSLMSISSNPNAYGATANDLNNMRNLINLLQNKKDELLNSFKNTFTSNNNYSNLYGGGGAMGGRDFNAQLYNHGDAYSSTSTYSGGSPVPPSFLSVSSSSSPYSSTNEDKNDLHINSISQSELLKVEEEIMKQQDEQLDYLEGSVHNLKYIGNTINEEVTLHHRLLEDTNNNVTTTTSQLSRNRRMLTRLVRKASNMKLILIIILLIAILVFLVFFL